MSKDLIQEAEAKEVGVLLPDVDPMVGEMIVQTFESNRDKSPAEVILGLVLAAPEELKVEMLAACMSLLICKEKGALYWVQDKAANILVGARRIVGYEGVQYGHSAWPMAALVTSTPKRVVIDTPRGHIPVWIACEGLDGSVIRQSEAIALGNAMVEGFGGKIIEDRKGPEVMRQSMIEGNFTKRAKARAEARERLRSMTIESKAADKRNHATAAMAEAVPGLLRDGKILIPEEQRDIPEDEQNRYEVAGRLNDTFVLIRALKEGINEAVAACAWVAADPSDAGPIGKEGPPHYGFTDEATVA